MTIGAHIIESDDVGLNWSGERMADVIITAGAVSDPDGINRKHTVAWTDPVTGSVLSVVVSMIGESRAEISDHQDKALEEAKKLVTAFRCKLDGPIRKLPKTRSLEDVEKSQARVSRTERADLFGMSSPELWN